MGNKVRQFTGMTSPLTIVVSEVPGENGESSGEGAEAGNAATESEAGEKGEEADTYLMAKDLCRFGNREEKDRYHCRDKV